MGTSLSGSICHVTEAKCEHQQEGTELDNVEEEEEIDDVIEVKAKRVIDLVFCRPVNYIIVVLNC